MSRYRTILVQASAVVILVIGLWPSIVLGQGSGILSGEVLDAKTFEPIVGAVVSVSQTSMDTVTDDFGRFVLDKVPVGETTIRIAASGYAVIVENTEIAPSSVTYAQFHVMSVAAFLEEMQVVGRWSDDAVAKDMRADPDQGNSALSVLDVLARSVPGVVITRAGGEGGRTGQIVIRGMTSLNTSNEPIIVLNGVRIGTSLGGGGDAFRILQEISATEVRRIRVMRGSSAGAMYSDAANGIIFIDTGPTVR